MALESVGYIHLAQHICRPVEGSYEHGNKPLALQEGLSSMELVN
jgi:hypothetical protein